MNNQNILIDHNQFKYCNACNQQHMPNFLTNPKQNQSIFYSAKFTNGTNVDPLLINQMKQSLMKGKYYNFLKKNYQKFSKMSILQLYVNGYISDKEHYIKIKLTPTQLKQQIEVVVNNVTNQINELKKLSNINNDENVIVRLFLYQLDKHICITNDYNEISKSLIVLNAMLVSACSIQEVSLYFGISQYHVKKYWYLGLALVQYFYINQFQGKQYWTKTRIRESIPPEYQVLFGYEICKFFYLYILLKN